MVHLSLRHSLLDVSHPSAVSIVEDFRLIKLATDSGDVCALRDDHVWV